MLKLPNKDDSRLERQFIRIERTIPRVAGRFVRWLRQPYTRLVRIPLGLLLVCGGLLSVLPFLGIWMLPLGLLLLAVDVPLLRRPVGRFAVRLQRHWNRMRRSARARKRAQERKDK